MHTDRLIWSAQVELARRLPASSGCTSTQLSRRLSSTLAPNIPLTQLSIRLVHIAKLPSSHGSSALPGGRCCQSPAHPHRAGDTILCQIGCTVHRCTTGSATQKCTGGTQDRPKVVHHPFPLSKAQKHKSSDSASAGSARLDRSSTLEAVKPDEGCPRPPHPLSCTPRNQPHPRVFHTLHPARAVSLEPLKKT